MVFRSLGIPFFGHNGEDDGEAMAAGDGEGLGIVGVVEHIVADGIEGGARMRQCVGTKDAEFNKVIATYNLIMNKLRFSASIGQVTSLQGDASAHRDGVFKDDEGVLYQLAVCTYQVLRFYLNNIHVAVVARGRHLHGAVVVGSKADGVVNNIFYFVVIVQIKRG